MKKNDSVVAGLAVQSENNYLVELLGERKIWLTWTRQPSEEPDGRLPKKPTRLLEDGRRDFYSATNPDFLRTYAEAKSTIDDVIPYALDGVGGVGLSVKHLSDIEMVDIDRCVDDGEITNCFVDQFVECADTYTELSPSGTGLRLAFVVSDSKPKSGFKKLVYGEGKGGVEMQTNCTFYTYTGNVFRDLPVRVITRVELAELYAIVGINKEERPSLPFTPVWPTIPTEPVVANEDDALIEKARKAENGWKFSLLYDAGDWKAAGYPSQSEADQGLCGILVFWTNDANRIDRIFRTSKLMRPKWDEKRPNNSTYGWDTIRKAIESPHDEYAGPKAQHASQPFTVISDFELLAMNIPDVDWFITQLFAKGTLNMFSAPPNQFKSWVCLCAAICVAHGRPLFGKFETSMCNVLYINEEDNHNENKKRYRMLLNDGEEPGGVHFIIDSGRKIDEKWAGEIVQIAKERNIGFVVLDSLRSLHSEKENDSDSMQKVVDNLRILTRNGLTVLYTHHHRKGQGGNADQPENEMDKARGSSGIGAAVHTHITCSEKNVGDHYLVLNQAKLKAAKKIAPFTVRICQNPEETKLWFEYGGEYDPEVLATGAKKSRLLDHFQRNAGTYYTRKSLVAMKFAADSDDKTLIWALDDLVHGDAILKKKFGELTKREQRKVPGQNGHGAFVYWLPSSRLNDSGASKQKQSKKVEGVQPRGDQNL